MTSTNHLYQLSIIYFMIILATGFNSVHTVQYKQEKNLKQGVILLLTGTLKLTYDHLMGKDIKMILYHTKLSLPMVPTAKEELIIVMV